VIRLFANKAAWTVLGVIAIAGAALTISRSDFGSAASSTDVVSVPAARPAPPLPSPDGRVVEVTTEPMLQEAIRALASNTTIVLGPGTYHLTSTLWISGTLSNVGIRGATGNRDDVVLVGDGMRGSATVGAPHGIWTGGDVRGVTIADLTIRDVPQHPLIFNAGTQRPHVHNVRLVDAGQQFIKANPDGAGGGVNDGMIEYSLIEYTQTAKDSYTNGVDVHTGANWVIRHNEFRNIVSPARAGLAGPAVLMWHGSKGTLTEGNTFLNCARGISYGLEEKPGFDHHGGIIRDNFFFRSREQPGDVGILVADSPETQVLNNSVFVSGTYPTPIEYRFVGSHRVIIARNRLDGAIQSRDGATALEHENRTDDRAVVQR